VSTPTLPIVIIGPMAAGKSTVAGALSRRLQVPQVPLDAVRWYYHLKDGLRFSDQIDHAKEGGFAAVVRYWEPYSIAAVERVLTEFPDSIIDFGAGHAHFEDPDRVRRLEAALAPIENVILLMPSADVERTLALCTERDAERLGPQRDATRDPVNERYVRSECFRRVCKTTVFVEDMTIDETVDHIVAGLR
jgi:hypothetical protein